MKKILIALCLGALLTGGSALAAEPDDEYVISSRDHIKISVMFHDDLSGTYVPLSDNTFEYPLIGTVSAPGKTLLQLTEELKQRLSEYIIEIAIFVASYPIEAKFNTVSLKKLVRSYRSGIATNETSLFSSINHSSLKFVSLL